MDNLILTNESEGILELVLNRPTKLNTLSDEVISAFEKALGRFANQPSLRVMLIRANGKYFSAGVEINQDISPEAGCSTLKGRHWYRNKFLRIFEEIEAIEKPIVVAHQGPCLGAHWRYHFPATFVYATFCQLCPTPRSTSGLFLDQEASAD
ncbi:MULTISPECIES: enoyl-CoA hydratase/isomerase family protein [Pseudomonas fluorescens group]|uniref:enoyl-CoA hydratase/isomerase family protein n=1 Tax=Pseudomonas fluorescens group TaxID=136843 RepID=UPI000B172D95|nr:MULTISPECIES: enoyl-CoA hydratase/isomerase family protein [Pseudomonas fluorescens group]WGT28014.1 enoyl-CoA hydratase/isomerase family protein [Pseudomonas marginalis]